MKFILISLLFFSYLNINYAYKVLYLMPRCGKSHLLIYEPLINELAKRNHHVTAVLPFTFLKPHPNIREIDINLKKAFNSDAFAEKIMSTSKKHLFSEFLGYKYYVEPSCKLYLKNTEIQELLKNGKQFDVAIVDTVLNDCALATAPLFGRNIILHSSSSFVSWMPSFLPRPPSYVPNSLIEMGSRMNFFQRLENAFISLGVRLIYNYDYIPHVQKLIANHLPENPLIVDAIKSIDFALTNADPVITSPRPSIPTIADVGGMQCRKAEQVPKEFEDFIQSSGDNGFILFSLGSIAQSQYIPKGVTESLLKAFSQLKYHVIWKYEGKIENLPKNVKISKWLPQKDLLGHPKIRLFITHGGMLSLQESVYNAVPVIAVPLFAEQPGNVVRVEEIRIGVKLELNKISVESVLEAITKVLDDKSYVENVTRYSSIFREFAENQTENAADLVEYIIRHNGAPHLRSAGEELNFFQYFLLDVIAFLLFISSIAVFIAFKLGKFIAKKICSCKNSTPEGAKQKKIN